jgi:hypothetical protein
LLGKIIESAVDIAPILGMPGDTADVSPHRRHHMAF